ncbi:MAG TPA: SDR family NAD(P)-dependent oxidoreductase [Anaerovoracaceae bacterium]|nr:SDR family NAD(P)-dependent oxidoreductase [Anaerovoracaceae bacterium]
MSSLKGKNIVITGATRGLGRVYALHLAGLGANIGIIHRDLYSYKEYEAEKKLAKADTILEELSGLGVKVYGVEADVTNKDQVFDAMEQFQAKLGSIDVVICNAGGGIGKITDGKPSELDLDVYEKVIDRNLNGTVYTVTAALPYMKQQRSGKIITVASHVGVQVNSDGSYTHYGIAKSGIIYFTKSIAQEVGRFGVTANCLAPGYISTARLAMRFEETGADHFIKNTALKRFGTPEECARVVEFLASDMSDYVTGAVIEVTGGTVGKLDMEWAL